MSKKILYINFYSSEYLDKEAFVKEQASTLSYKSELGKTQTVHYLLNNNLQFNERYESIQLVSKKLTKWAFLKTVEPALKKPEAVPHPKPQSFKH